MAPAEDHNPGISTGVALGCASSTNGATLQGTLFSTSLGARSGNHTCFQCQKCFTESRSLARHLRDSCKYNNLPKGRYRCDWCNSSLGRNDILHRHVKEVHLLQGNEKRMSKMRREASCVLYGEALDACSHEEASEDPLVSPRISNLPSIEHGSVTRSDNLSEQNDPGMTVLCIATKRHSDINAQQARCDVRSPFDTSEFSPPKLLGASISGRDPTGGGTWPSASAPTAIDDLKTPCEDMANLTSQQITIDGFEIEDWINVGLLDQHDEYNGE